MNDRKDPTRRDGRAAPGAVGPAKGRWRSMEVAVVGSVAEVVQGGGGKLTAIGTDPGEQRKTMTG